MPKVTQQIQGKEGPRAWASCLLDRGSFHLPKPISLCHGVPTTCRSHLHTGTSRDPGWPPQLSSALCSHSGSGACRALRELSEGLLRAHDRGLQPWP